MYSGWDEKTFNRSGDLVAVAVLKTLDDSEMASPENVKFVLLIVRMAFECPQYCVKVTDDRRPRMTLLLLEHLNEITGGKMQTDIEEVKHFILQQASKANCQMTLRCRCWPGLMWRSFVERAMRSLPAFYAA
jgi:hypothetical protein